MDPEPDACCCTQIFQIFRFRLPCLVFTMVQKNVRDANYK